MHMKLLGKGVGGRGERYTCTLCGEQGSKTVVTLHLHENHMDTLNQCKTCGKRFNGAGHLRKTKQKLTLCLKDFFSVHYFFDLLINPNLSCLVSHSHNILNFCLVTCRLHMKTIHKAKFVYHWYIPILHSSIHFSYFSLIINFRYIWYLLSPPSRQAADPSWLSPVWPGLWEQIQKCCPSQEAWGSLHL